MTNIGRPLPHEFYQQDTLNVAQKILGQKVIRRLPSGETLSGLIVETEAYITDDPAMFAYKVPTGRNKVLFGPPGHAYLYLTYRVHVMFNIACATEGIAESVLIRALEPLDGKDTMRGLRGGMKDTPLLTNGPGKLTAALGLTTALNGVDVTDEASDLQIVASVSPTCEIVATTRIGLTRGMDLPYRFYIRDNPWVSRLAFSQ